MPKQYTCELCQKVFAQKIDFTRHKNKKAPCVSVEKIQELARANEQEKEKKIDVKNNLATLFNYCLDVLRNNEHLTGDKALRALAYLLDLRLLEAQFGGPIDIDNYKYDMSEYEDAEEYKTKLLNLVRFSNLAKVKEVALIDIMKALWNTILSAHPATKNIFLPGKGFDIQNNSTYKKLIDKLYTFDFENIDEDILGEAYEEVIKNVMTGKVLGQFFTPPKVKQMMVKLVNPQIKKDGTCDKIFDPAMGTGGFLITALRHLVARSKESGIDINWQYISSEGLGGREAEPDTYQLAVSNMLISSGYMSGALEKGDSVRDPITNKYDIIFANPPFGIDGLIYNEISHGLRNEYLPIKSNSAVPLFLQAIIYMLNVGGKCAIVLPYGQELQSKSANVALIREFLMKTCDLKEVIYLPAGIFTHTTIKTCVLYFVKRKEGKDVLTIKIKRSKTQTEVDRSYTFADHCATATIKFYDYNPDDDNKTLLVEAGINDLIKNKYSLNYTNYIVEENDDEIGGQPLGALCTFKSGKQLSKSKIELGQYPVIGGGKKPVGYHNAFNKDKSVILCSSSGTAGYISKYESEVWASDCFSIHSKDQNILNEKYLYYYLKSIQDEIYKLQTGTAQPHIYAKTIEHIKIPVPPMDEQLEIIKYFEDNQRRIDDMNNEINKIRDNEKTYIQARLNKDVNLLAEKIAKL